jgi:trans-aconitate methyltransferase
MTAETKARVDAARLCEDGADRLLCRDDVRSGGAGTASPAFWSAADYAANARFVADLASPVVELLAPRAGERILDLGCGDGALTEAIAASGAEVVGVDGSADMVRAARARGLDARVVDGQRLAFAGAFDAVFSNAALHWMPDAPAVLAGVRRALVTGGRFVGEMGGHGNVAAIATALRASLRARGIAPARAFGWFFPTVAQYGDLLRAHGFVVRQIALIPRPTFLPTGIAGWLATFAAPFLADVPEAEHLAILQEVESLLEPALRDSGGDWIVDYVRLRFFATAA